MLLLIHLARRLDLLLHGHHILHGHQLIELGSRLERIVGHSGACPTHLGRHPLHHEQLVRRRWRTTHHILLHARIHHLPALLVLLLSLILRTRHLTSKPFIACFHGGSSATIFAILLTASGFTQRAHLSLLLLALRGLPIAVLLHYNGMLLHRRSLRRRALDAGPPGLISVHQILRGGLTDIALVLAV